MDLLIKELSSRISKQHLKHLEKLHMWATCSILCICWQDRVTIVEVLDKAKTMSIEAMLLKSQIQWSGHVTWMDGNQIPKQLLFGELGQQLRKQGRPYKRYKDNLKNSLKWCGIRSTYLAQTAQDRPWWSALTMRVSASLEEECRRQSEAACECHHRATFVPAVTTEFQCPVCSRHCKSRLGLQSHVQVHR